MFSPNGTLPAKFWPGKEGDLSQSSILAPLKPFQNQTAVLKGISNRVGGDGDSHMRGMSCLLTGARLHPGNIQGGGGPPAGWASGISVDQDTALLKLGSQFPTVLIPGLACVMLDLIVLWHR